MANPLIQIGTAVIYGLGGAVSVSGLAGLMETAKANHKFKLDNVEDENGSDAALIATNEHVEADFVIVPTETSGFVAPLSTVVTAGFEAEELNGSWHYIGDQAVDLSHKQAKVSIKCRRYIDNTNGL